MTFFYPDISGYDAGISLTGMLAVVVKATEGTTYTNPDYARVAGQARAAGLPLAGYHFLRHGSDPAAQADHYHAVAGNAPCMLDVETADDGTKATVSDALTFSSRLKSLGGAVRLVYLPRWYWQALGSPDLAPLGRAGMALVSSNYTTYSDTGPGWTPYGGMAPVVWQYTDAHSLNGFSVDMNAYRGTVEQFRALLNGGDPTMADQETIDLHDRSNWMVTPAAQLTPTTPGHPLPGSMVDRLNAFAQDPAAFLAGVVGATLTDAQAQALTAAVVAAMPSAADVAAHIDVKALASALAGHFSVTP